MDDLNQHSDKDERITPPDLDLSLSRDMEEKVVQALRREGLITGSKIRYAGTLKIAAGILILLSTFLLGWLSGSNGWPGVQTAKVHLPEQQVQEKQFVLLAYDPEGFKATDGLNAEYGRWVQRYSETGGRIWGAELTGTGWLLQTSGATPYQPGTYGPPSKGYLSGFFVITANSEQQAREIASTCPHIRHGGILELRSTIN